MRFGVVSALIFSAFLAVLPGKSWAAAPLCSRIFAADPGNYQISWNEAKLFRQDIAQAMGSNRRVDQNPLLRAGLVNMQNSIETYLLPNEAKPEQKKALDDVLGRVKTASKKGLTYKEYFDLSVDVMDVITHGHLKYLHTLYSASDRPGYSAWNFFPPASKAQDTFVFLPLMKDTMAL